MLATWQPFSLSCQPSFLADRCLSNWSLLFCCCGHAASHVATRLLLNKRKLRAASDVSLWSSLDCHEAASVRALIPLLLFSTSLPHAVGVLQCWDCYGMASLDCEEAPNRNSSPGTEPDLELRCGIFSQYRDCRFGQYGNPEIGMSCGLLEDWEMRAS